MSLKILAEKLKKKHGDGIIEIAANSEALILHRFKSGIFELDRCTGGWPLGRCISIWGDTSSGKSTIIFKTIADSYHYCRNCFGERRGWPTDTCKCKKKFEPFRTVYLDIEGTLDPGWAEVCGVNNDTLYVSHPPSAEIALDVGEEVVKSGEAEILVIDSVAALVPTVEAEGSHSDQQYAAGAKLLNKALRKLIGGIVGRGMHEPMKTSIFLLNQQRTEMQRFITRLIRPGGKGQVFAASIEVRTKQEKNVEENKDTGERFIKFKFNVPKNKTFEPKLESLFSICVHGGDAYSKGDIKEVEEVFKAALRYETINKEGATYYWAIPFPIEEEHEKTIRSTNQKDFIGILESNPESLEILKKITLDKIYQEQTGE